MKRRAVTGVLSLAFIFSGCVLSVEPMVSEEDCRFLLIRPHPGVAGTLLREPLQP